MWEEIFLGLLGLVCLGYALFGWKYFGAVIRRHQLIFIGKTLGFMILGAWLLPLIYAGLIPPAYIPLDYVFSGWTALGFLLFGIGLCDLFLVRQHIRNGAIIKGKPRSDSREEGGESQL